MTPKPSGPTPTARCESGIPTGPLPQRSTGGASLQVRVGNVRAWGRLEDLGGLTQEDCLHLPKTAPIQTAGHRRQGPDRLVFALLPNIVPHTAKKGQLIHASSAAALRPTDSSRPKPTWLELTRKSFPILITSQHNFHPLPSVAVSSRQNPEGIWDRPTSRSVCLCSGAVRHPGTAGDRANLPPS